MDTVKPTLNFILGTAAKSRRPDSGQVFGEGLLLQRQRSNLGKITKQSDRYFRNLLVVGMTSRAVMARALMNFDRYSLTNHLLHMHPIHL